MSYRASFKPGPAGAYWLWAVERTADRTLRVVASTASRADAAAQSDLWAGWASDHGEAEATRRVMDIRRARAAGTGAAA